MLRMPPHSPPVLKRTLWCEHHLCPSTLLGKTILILLTNKHKQASANAFVPHWCHVSPKLQSLPNFASRDASHPWFKTAAGLTEKSRSFVTGRGMAILGTRMPLPTSTPLARDKGKSGSLEFPLQKLEDPRLTKDLKNICLQAPRAY